MNLLHARVSDLRNASTRRHGNTAAAPGCNHAQHHVGRESKEQDAARGGIWCGDASVDTANCMAAATCLLAVAISVPCASKRLDVWPA